MGIDAEYGQFVERLPGDLKGLARSLPRRLHLTQREGGGWEDYTRLEPFRDLPAFAAEEAVLDAGRPIPRDVLDLYRRAHCHGGFFGLLVDRLADGQAPPALGIDRLIACFEEEWKVTLAAANGDPALPIRLIESAISAWRRGLCIESRLLAPGALSIPLYWELVALKTEWLATSALCLLLRVRNQQRYHCFRLSTQLLVFSAQCLDDAADHEEDERLLGVSYPSALGYPPGGLARAAPRLLRLAQRIAEEGGFSRFAIWLAEHASAIDALGPPGHRLQNELAAMIIAGSVEAACRIREPGV